MRPLRKGFDKNLEVRTMALGSVNELHNYPDRFNLRDFSNLIWRHWGVIVLTTAAGLIAAWIALLLIQPRYKASSQLLFEFGGTPNPAYNLIQVVNPDQAAVESQLAVLRSGVVLRRVVETERLQEDPEFGHASSMANPAFSMLSVTKLLALTGIPDVLRQVGISKWSAPTAVLPKLDRAEESVQRLEQALIVERSERTYVVDISVTSADPQKAATLANAVVQAYIEDRRNYREQVDTEGAKWLQLRLAAIGAEVQKTDGDVAKYRVEHAMLRTGSNVSANEQRLSDLQARLIVTRAAVTAQKARLDQLQNIRNNGGDIYALPDVLSSQVITALRAQQVSVSRRQAELISRYGDRYPDVLKASAELQDVKKALENETSRIAADIKNEYDNVKFSNEAVEQGIRELTSANGRDEEQNVQLRELERTASATRSLYEDLLSRSKAVQERRTFDKKDARVLTVATAPTVPSRPVKSQVIGFGTGLGVCFGLALAFIVDNRRNGFTTAGEVEHLLGFDVLASVRTLTRRERKLRRCLILPQSFALRNPRSQFAGTLRSIIVGIRVATWIGKVRSPSAISAKVIQVTSSLPGEGKTTIGMSLAFLAASGRNQKVAIVDADFRRAEVTRFYGLEAQPGVVDVLNGKIAASDVYHVDSSSSVHVYGRGSETDSPTALLASYQMQQFIEFLRSDYDLILIDSPPMLPVADAVAIMPMVDKILFVIRWRETPRASVSNAIRLLPSKSQVTGVVLNLIDEKASRKYGDRSSSYYYETKLSKSYFNKNIKQEA